MQFYVPPSPVLRLLRIQVEQRLQDMFAVLVRVSAAAVVFNPWPWLSGSGLLGDLEYSESAFVELVHLIRWSSCCSASEFEI